MGKSKIRVKIFFASKMLIDNLISRYLHHKSLLKGIDMAFVKKENRSMKLIPFVLALIPVIAFSKTRLEDYYVGFEIATAVSHDYLDGESFELSTNIPLESSSLNFNLMIGNLDTAYSFLGTNYEIDVDQLDIGTDYLYHFQEFDGLIPFVGIGLNYIETTVGLGGVSADVDDVLWNLYLGVEFSISDQLTLTPQLRLHQGFDDIFDGAELEASVALTYWLNDHHGLSLNYTNNYLGDIDFLGLQYLYSWE